MAHLENKTLSNIQRPPICYARYVDDIFIQTNNLQQIQNIKDLFEINSALKFTIEENIQGKLPFIYVMINKNNNKFSTTVYHKPTDDGLCLNANSEFNLI